MKKVVNGGLVSEKELAFGVNARARKGTGVRWDNPRKEGGGSFEGDSHNLAQFRRGLNKKNQGNGRHDGLLGRMGLNRKSSL